MLTPKASVYVLSSIGNGQLYSSVTAWVSTTYHSALVPLKYIIGGIQSQFRNHILG